MICIFVADNYGHFASPIEEYIKRLGSNIELIRIKPSKIGDIQQIRAAETEKICEVLKKRKLQCFLLDEIGKQMTTIDFSCLLRKEVDAAREPIFVIGGAYGVDKELMRPYICNMFGLSNFTLPHSLALLVLLEQIYRANEIWKGSKYHHV